MGSENNGLRGASLVNVEALPEKWRAPVERFLARFDGLHSLSCAILYGSLATGNHYPGSDIDLILISSGIPADFWKRLKALSDLYEPGVPIDALLYTPEEFAQMIEDMHVTALDATTEGIPLAGTEVFEGFKKRAEVLFGKGLHRKRDAWTF